MSHAERSWNNEYSGHFEDADGSAVAAERTSRIGGIKPGSAFFGWLTAVGMSVLLTALAAAAGAGVGLGTHADTAQLAGQETVIGIVGAVVLAVILLVSYFCGGYVAGRMARFDGARQGFAVWLWAVVIAVILGALVAVAGRRFDVLSGLNSFPRIPVDEGTLTIGGIIALIVAAVIALMGALLGGMAGMHYHRRIDRAAQEPFA